MRKECFAISILTVFLSSCIKQPEYSNVPAIKFVSVSSPYVTVNGVDTITFSFTDGDGDVGPNPAYPGNDNCIAPGVDSSVLYKNYYNIIIFPSNLGSNCPNGPAVFASPTVSPGDNSKALSGQIQVFATIQSRSCLQCGVDTCSNPASSSPTAGNDSVSFTIYLRDLAGHLSNALKTPYIYTGCQ